LRPSQPYTTISASMGQSSMSLRGKFVSVTYGRQCESAGVRKNSGLVDEVVDLAVGGVDLALKACFLLWVVRG